MASTQGDEGDWDEAEWDMDTDEINELSSDELYQRRPNRWRGPPSSWRTLTEDDRLAATALEGLRNQDLSIHLYNAFALKTRADARNEIPGEAVKYIDAHTGLPVGQHDWVPPPSWTAWPLRAQVVPADDFMGRTDDENEIFTLRQVQRQFPGTQLEEALSATALRYAKERFRRRDLAGGHRTRPQGTRETVATAVKEEVTSSGMEDTSNEYSESESGHLEPLPVTGEAYQPTVSADDDLSYHLLRPSTRLIMERLDKTLMLLHNARVASVNDHGDSFVSDSEDELPDDKASGGRQKGKISAAVRSATVAKGRPVSAEYSPAVFASGKKVGRPRSRHRDYERTDGETDREYAKRIARMHKKKIPVFSDDDVGAEPEMTGRETTPKPKKTAPARLQRRRSNESEKGGHKDRSLGQWALRDWSDVIAAAALAGYSPSVIARAKQRCSDLFRQDMELRSMVETGRKAGSPGDDRVEIGPDVSSLESEMEDEARTASMQAKIVHRRPTMALTSVLKMEDDSGDRHPLEKESSSAGLYFCPHTACPRAREGFSRRRNLERHIGLLHGGSWGDMSDEEKSEDEMFGAVHTDGFLKPIRIRKGWKGKFRGTSSSGIERLEDPADEGPEDTVDPGREEVPV